MLAGRYDMIIEQGQDCDRYVNWRNSDPASKDLSAWTAATFTIRPYRGHTGSEILELTKADAEIVLSDGLGSYNIKIIITDVQSAALTFDRAIYTLELEDASNIKWRVLEGVVHLSKETTN